MEGKLTGGVPEVYDKTQDNHRKCGEVQPEWREMLKTSSKYCFEVRDEIRGTYE